MAQAVGDAGDNIPVVASRRNGEDWLVTMRFSDFQKMLAKLYPKTGAQ